MMYGQTITLFNFHGGKWYTTVFTDADVSAVKSGSASQHGQTNTDTVEIIIHVRRSDAGILQIGDEGKCYTGAKAFAALESPNGWFTFTPEVDFIAVGDHASAEPLSDDEYEEGLYHEMNRTQDGVFMVTSAALYMLLPHFEIGGR